MLNLDYNMTSLYSEIFSISRESKRYPTSSNHCCGHFSYRRTGGVGHSTNLQTTLSMFASDVIWGDRINLSNCYIINLATTPPSDP